MSEETIKNLMSVCSIQSFMLAHYKHKREMKEMNKWYKDLEDAFNRYERKVTPNNRLKMQGKPMRRKGGRA